jgi:AAA+ superfamily predicted ATPase
MLGLWDIAASEIMKEDNDEVVKNALDEAKNELVEFLNGINSKKIRKSKNLTDATMLLQQYFRANLKENGWIYRKDFKEDRHYPFVATRIHLREDRQDSRIKWIEITLVNNSKNKTETTALKIESENLKEHKNSIPDVVRALNILFETDELKAEYEQYVKDYHEKESMQNEQFVSTKGIKYINDNMFEKEQNKGRYNDRMSLFVSSSLVEHAENCPIAFEPLIYVFNLNRHQFEWQDTRDIKLYKYDHTIVDKLILPKEHKGLIDILTSDFIQDNGSDIIQGKSGGTIILCKGKAGLGKTLTAEIYSELKDRPLYSVHSGQLGTDGTTIENKLKESFERSERWGAVLLIDEADVYIRERDNDTNHNAIVASFLRVMEYYNGLMFMTTNRENDIDDAILSRCMSVLTYKHQVEAVKTELWKIYLEQFNVQYDTALITELNKEFKEISGRDIKNVTRLVSRYIQGYKLDKATVQTFIDCAIFRGIREITE